MDLMKNWQQTKKENQLSESQIKKGWKMGTSPIPSNYIIGQEVSDLSDKTEMIQGKSD